MKKVKLQFKYDELHAIYGDLFNTAIPTGKLDHVQMMTSALLVNLYMKLGGKIMFRTDKKMKLTLDAATACALVLHVSQKELNHADYTHNVYLRILSEIDQQLA